jgi:hypothetical protein
MVCNWDGSTWSRDYQCWIGSDGANALGCPTMNVGCGVAEADANHNVNVISGYCHYGSCGW